MRRATLLACVYPKVILDLIFCLFGRKIFSIVKYFRRNHFLEKNDFPENIFRHLAHMKKITTTKNHQQPFVSDSGQICQNLGWSDSGEMSSKSGTEQSDSSKSG
jgi:hypothetical protein